jgi:hypothetical protein
MIIIDGEKVTKFYINGELQGNYLNNEDLTTLKDTYNLLKEMKEFDKKHYIDDDYFITCVTEQNHIYGDYTIRKYKNKYNLVYRKEVKIC